MSKSPAPALSGVLRSQLQGRLLAEVFLGNDELGISDLARLLDAPVATVRREADRLVKAGVLADRSQGRNRMVRANRDSLAHGPLRELILVTFGPTHVIADEFQQVDGIGRLFIYGSWAARYLGEQGPEPGDVDVLIVGSPDRDEVFDASVRAEKRLHREVNTTIVSLDRWSKAEDPFLREIQRRPLIPIIQGEVER